MNRKFLPAATIADPTLGPRQVKVIANSGLPDRVGDVLVASGCDLTNYRKNPVVLWQHDPSRPVGNAAVYVTGNQLQAVITFAPAGASRDADEACSLMKSGVLGAVSVGFRPISSEPIRGSLGIKYESWELMELSVVSVPCDADALVIARSMHSKSGRVLSGRNSASLAALVRCLSKSEDAHFEACDMLDKADRHRERAMRHAARIAASQGDSGGSSDDPEDDPGNDPDDNVELAYGAEHRKRLIEIAVRGAPTNYDASEEARRGRMIEVLARAHAP